MGSAKILIADHHEQTNPPKGPDCLLGEGEMAARMRELDWSKTPLGPMEEWPQSLKTSVSICLASRFPIVMYWGPDYVVLYNDAYSAILGNKHPWALGQPCSVCWAEIWDTIGPMLDEVVSAQRATWSDDLLLLLRRNGYSEECYFSFSFSPIRIESGLVGGVFTAVMETTDRVIGERRLRTLRDLAARALSGKSEIEVLNIAATTLAENPHDIPFAILCEVTNQDQVIVLRTAGIDHRHRLCALLSDPHSTFAPSLLEAVRRREVVEAQIQGESTDSPPAGAWKAPPETLLALPVGDIGREHSCGLLLTAVNPHKAATDSYVTFFQLVSNQIATSLADARSHEEEHRRTEALAELDRAKTAFFSNVSHEFRTPLTLMLGPLEELLASADGLSTSQRERIAVTHRNSLRLLKLVNTLLDFSRIESGRIRASYRATDLATFTAELASVFRSATERAGLQLVIDCPAVAELAYVDREMWEKIVFNLLSNAFKFTFEGEIRVATSIVNGQVELAVSDTGTGIPAEDLSHLFERFYRVKDARGRSYEGSGIGLALVQELVKLHGGSVRVQSEVGRGSTFTVSVPLGKDHLPQERIEADRTAALTGMQGETYAREALRWLPDAAEISDEPHMPLPSRPTKAGERASAEPRPRILLADDNADMREYARQLLADRYEIEAVPDGESALQHARRHHPDLILSDVMMPRLDGFGLLHAIRADQALKSIPVVLLSARAGEESRVEGLDGGADDYLVKPFSARELLARVGSALRMAEIRREAAEATRQSELRFRQIIDSLPAAIYTTDAEGRLTHFNQAAVKFSGHTPQLGTDHWCVSWKLYYPDGTPMRHDECPMAVALKEGRIIEGAEAIAERPDGTRRWFTPFPTPLRDRNGKIIGGINMLVDITDRKHAERTDSLLAGIVDSSDDAIVSKTLDGIITSWNLAAERVFGYTAEEAIGQHITLIIPPDRWSEEDMIIAKLRRGERIDHFETVRRRKDGSPVELAVTISPVRDASGHVIGASKVARDVSERKRAERALADAALKQQVLFHLADELHRANSLPQVYTAALNAICNAMRCERASILLYDENGVMRFVSWRGLSASYREAVEGHSPWKPEDPDPHPVPIENVDRAELNDELKKIVKSETIESLCFVPLVSAGKLIGKFMVYFPTPHVFTGDQLSLSLTIARQLAFTIERKRNDEALKASEERFRTLSETLESEVRARTRELEDRNADVVRQSEQLRELSWRLLRIQDDERRRIARELHDSAGQTLTALGMNLAQITQKAQGSTPPLTSYLQQAEDLIRQLHSEIRTMSYLLHPPLLDETGLAPALTWYIEGLRSRSRLEMTLIISEELGRLPSEMELVIFRVVQECLTNIHRHSGSKSAAIAIARTTNSVTVEVRDRGKGMSPKKLADIQSRGSGVGIRGMRERVSQLHGDILIESNSSGTRVFATIPISAERSGKHKTRVESLPAAV